jgi:hypothetical protein
MLRLGNQVVTKADHAFISCRGTDLDLHPAAVRVVMQLMLEALLLPSAASAAPHMAPPCQRHCCRCCCCRSLKAVYFLQQAGFRNVAYISGGIAEWRRNKLPMADGAEDLAAVAGLRSNSSSRDDDDDDDDVGGGLRLGGLRLPQLTSVFSR